MNSKNVKFLKIISILSLVVIFSTSVYADLSGALGSVGRALNSELTITNYSFGTTTAPFWTFVAAWVAVYGIIYALITSDFLTGNTEAGKPKALSFLGENPKASNAIAIALAGITIYALPVAELFAASMLLALIIVIISAIIYGYRWQNSKIDEWDKEAKDREVRLKEEKLERDKRDSEIKKSNEELSLSKVDAKKVMTKALSSLPPISKNADDTSLEDLAEYLTRFEIGLPVFTATNIKLAYSSVDYKGKDIIEKAKDNLRKLVDVCSAMRHNRTAKDYDFIKKSIREYEEKRKSGEFSERTYSNRIHEVQNLSIYIDRVIHEISNEILVISSKMEDFDRSKAQKSLKETKAYIEKTRDYIEEQIVKIGRQQNEITKTTHSFVRQEETTFLREIQERKEEIEKRKRLKRSVEHKIKNIEGINESVKNRNDNKKEILKEIEIFQDEYKDVHKKIIKNVRAYENIVEKFRTHHPNKGAYFRAIMKIRKIIDHYRASPLNETEERLNKSLEILIEYYNLLKAKPQLTTGIYFIDKTVLRIALQNNKPDDIDAEFKKARDSVA
ncbi:hypothetical protein KY321_00800 [Candidatus Woesearchaeota archaeon]|nr:hypothetical protein [Candidatus Woesearchaeota archaeon]